MPNYRELEQRLYNYTDGWTKYDGAFPVETKKDKENAEAILKNHYGDVDPNHLDYDNKHVDGTDYRIEFDEALEGEDERFDRIYNSISKSIEDDFYEAYNSLNTLDEDFNREFIELPSFIKAWKSMGLSDTNLRELEKELSSDPKKGEPIQGLKGARKLRIALDNNKGKSSGARVIYIDIVVLDTIYLLYAYPKSKKTDLTAEDIKYLKKLIIAIKENI